MIPTFQLPGHRAPLRLLIPSEETQTFIPVSHRSQIRAVNKILYRIIFSWDLEYQLKGEKKITLQFLVNL
ncbi:hypothetical protein AGIG_G18442 [Arapaima gigas]